MFTVSHINNEHTVHHSSKVQCIEVLPWGTYIVPCIPSCNHSAVVLDKLVRLQEELSSIFSNRHFHFCSTPMHLEMKAPESRSSTPQHHRTVNCLWCWKELSLFTGPRDGQHTGSWSLFCFANASYLHWLWHGVMFWRQGQTDCTGHMKCVWRSHTSFLCLGGYPGVRRKLAGFTGTICSSAVRPY